MSTVTPAADGGRNARIAATWSRWAAPIATRSGVRGTCPTSETATASRDRARSASAAHAAAASASVRTVKRAGSSCRPHPEAAAVSMTSSRGDDAGTEKDNERSPGPVPDRKPVNG